MDRMDFNRDGEVDGFVGLQMMASSRDSAYNLFFVRCNFGGRKMAVSYNKLWKLLIDRGTNKTKLRKATNISSSTMVKLTKNKPVAMPVLERICEELECNIEDIMEFNKLDEVKLEMQQKEEPPDESIQ